MKLEKIVLNGFKSFADKTEFCFDAGITAIVGPNGCGKSNIVDAAKWVLGEQSVKSLRSGYMADVIFSGSSSKKSVGMAEVSLHFNEIAGMLPIETDQLHISRRLYRSGESEYLINNKTCRLKDIRELFMDTGVGVKAYSIIEQGQIDQLLNASKTDRRAIFEEAAGISKYKAHKTEALRKLDRTEQNLLRLADIVNEIQRQLRSIKLQAGKAKNYLQYSEKLKHLRVNYSLAEFHKLKTQLEAKNKVLGRLSENFAETAVQVAKNDTLLSQLRTSIIETENDINQADNQLVKANSRIEQRLQRIEFLRTRTTELDQRKVKAREQEQQMQQQLSQFTQEVELCRNQMTQTADSLQEKQHDLGRLEQEIHDIDTQCRSLETDLADEKSGIIDIVRITAQLHNELQSISTYRDNLTGQKKRLSGRAEIVKAELRQLLAEKAQNQARLADIEKVLADLQQSLEAKRTQSEQIEEQLTEDNRQLAQLKEARSAMNSELAVLEDLEDKREGLNNAVKTILKQRADQQGRFEYVEGIVADIIAAQPEYANAVEAALQGRTDTLIVNSITRFLEDKDSICQLEGRVNVICTQTIAPFVETEDLSSYPFVHGRLIEFVNYGSKYTRLAWKLLGRVVVVDSIENATDLAENLKAKYRFVTLDGEFLNNDGSISIGPLGKATGLISRKTRLKQLQDELTNLSAQIAGSNDSLEKNTQQNSHLEKLCRDLRTAVYESNTAKTEIFSKLGIIEQNINRLTEDEPVISSEIDLLAEQIAQSVKKEYASKQRLEELETVNAERTGRVAALEAQLTEQRKQHEQKAAGLTELKVLLGQIAEQQKAIKEKILSLQNQNRQGLTSLESAQAEIKECIEQIEQTQRDILTSESAVSELFVEKDKASRESSLLHQKVRDLLEEQNQTEELLRTKRTEQTEIDQQLQQAKIDISNLDVKKTDLTERIAEELQIDLAQAYENYNDQQIDWDSVREEIAQLRAKIERLGNVNIDAINEQADLEERNEFLTEQVEDLHKSKTQLQQLISKLNRQSRDIFAETFEKVRINFQEIFRKLFGGGKADILLEDPTDILESGVEIIAQPPGKQTRSLSLLSGGEKTMTALALLFGVFKTKPSPFCFLDEVDAALDEANNERFDLIVKEFQENSQFIIITHSKRTISIADVLFGITMQQRGVSKKISVRFDQFDETDETDETAAA